MHRLFDDRRPAPLAYYANLSFLIGLSARAPSYAWLPTWDPDRLLIQLTSSLMEHHERPRSAQEWC